MRETPQPTQPDASAGIRWRQMRLRIAVTAAGAVVALGGAIGYAVARDDPVDLASAACLAQPGANPATGAHVELRGSAPLEACAPLLREQGVKGPLVVCVDASAAVMVLPGSTCDEADLQDPPAGFEQAVGQWREFTDALDRRLADCTPPADAAVFAEQDLSARHLGRWQVTAAASEGCAEGFYINFQARTLVIG